LSVQIFVIWEEENAVYCQDKTDITMVARIFIGIPIVSETIELNVKSWRNDPLLNLNLINWVKPENWHITLFFLGNQQFSVVPLLQHFINESFNSVNASNTNMIGLGVFSNKNNPKVLWIGLENIQYLMLAYYHLAELLTQNRIVSDNKPLKPHLTVARIKRIEDSASFESFLTQNQQFHFGSVAINKVVLYESISTICGPVYNPLFVRELEI